MLTLLLISDVYFGKIVSVKPAPRDGSSMKKKFVSQSAIFAHHGTLNQEIVPNAIMDLLFKMESVLPMLILALCQKATFYAKYGQKKLVSNVHQEASSTNKDFVSQLAHNVTPTIRPQETALAALLDMISLKEDVNFQISIMPNQLILDVEHGIGKTKNALLVPIFGLSTIMEYVSQFLINAKPMLKMEIVLNVIRDMI